VEKGRAKKMAKKVGVQTLSSAEFLVMVHQGRYERPESILE
jgi:hypothetical protein